MLYITDKGINVVKEYSGKENIEIVNNAIYIQCKNKHYTYLKNGCFLCLEKCFGNNPYQDYFYFSQIKEISTDKQEKYIKLVLKKIKNINDINSVKFTSFYFVDENLLNKL